MIGCDILVDERDRSHTYRWWFASPELAAKWAFDQHPGCRKVTIATLNSGKLHLQEFLNLAMRPSEMHIEPQADRWEALELD